MLSESKNKTRLIIYKIIDEIYGDRINDFVVDPKPKAGAVASGNFSTPRLGGKNLIIDYEIYE